MVFIFNYRYSTSEQFRLVAYLTLVSMGYLSEEEFSQPEREVKNNNNRVINITIYYYEI